MPSGPATRASTSGDETRILRSAHGADTFYTRWSREARTAWQAFEAEVGERFFVEAGMLWFAHREDGFEAHSMAALTSLGIPVRRLSTDAISPTAGRRSRSTTSPSPRTSRRRASCWHGTGWPPWPGRSPRDGGRFELAWVEPGRHGRTTPPRRRQRRRDPLSRAARSCSRPGPGCRGSSRTSRASSSG